MAATTAGRCGALEAIELLLRPRSIAFVGASSDSTKQSGQPVRNVVAAGYDGRVYAVNRRGEQVGAAHTCRSIDELPEAADIGFVTVPAAQCAAAIRELGARGTRVAVIAVGGFAETGSETGARLTRDIVSAARDANVRLMGPVCNGSSLELIFSGRILHAAELRDAGLVSELAPEGGAANKAIELAHAMVRRFAANRDFRKQTIWGLSGVPLPAAMRVARSVR